MGLRTQRLYRTVIVALLLGCSRAVWAAPDQQMTIAPAAASGNTITAADENARSNTISTPYNTHTHADISTSTANSFSLGDGAAGNKSLCANAANSTDSCIRFNDTAKLWTLDNPTAGSFNEVATISGTSGLIANTVVVADGTSSLKSLTASAPADDQVLVASSATAAAWKSVPNCTDSGGNHLNYTAASNAWSCGTSAGTSLESGTWSLTSAVSTTIYQNTTGRKKRIAIYVQGTTNGKLNAYLEVGSANPPTIKIDSVLIDVNAAAANHDGFMYSEIPDTWYYRITTTVGSISTSYELNE